MPISVGGLLKISNINTIHWNSYIENFVFENDD